MSQLYMAGYTDYQCRLLPAGNVTAIPLALVPLSFNQLVLDIIITIMQNKKMCQFTKMTACMHTCMSTT